MTSIVHRLALLFLVVAGILIVGISVALGQAEEELTEAQEQELELLASLVSAALEGQIIPPEEPVGWVNDFVKSSEQTTFVPFTFSVEQTMFSSRVEMAPTVALYVFAEPQGGPTPSDSSVPIFEDAHHIDLDAPTAEGVYEIHGGFWGKAGDYDVYIALSESGVLDEDETETATMMFKRSLSVPNLWSGQLATSSVILAERIEVLAVPMPPDQLLANPYTLGTMRIVPKMTSEYASTGEFSSMLFVYNVGLTESGMPDVNVDYTFNTLGVEGNGYFNRTNPQRFNERTLPQGFDLTAGHQLIAGQEVSLSAFPPADYRLDIRVTDNTNGASLIRSVDFSVSTSYDAP